jgi:hypothetical protein
LRRGNCEGILRHLKAGFPDVDFEFVRSPRYLQILALASESKIGSPNYRFVKRVIPNEIGLLVVCARPAPMKVVESITASLQDGGSPPIPVEFPDEF